MIAVVTLQGCDDSTTVRITVDPIQIVLLVKLAALTVIKSAYSCMPRMTIEVEDE